MARFFTKDGRTLTYHFRGPTNADATWSDGEVSFDSDGNGRPVQKISKQWVRIEGQMEVIPMRLRRRPGPPSMRRRR